MENKKTIILAILGIAILAMITGNVFFTYDQIDKVNVSSNKNIKNESQISTPTPASTQTPTPTPKPADKVITVSIVGDTMAHQSQLDHDYNEDPLVYDFMPSLEKIKDTISKSDFAMANLETTISGKKMGYSGYPDFNTPESFIEALKETGFDLVTLGNNHAIDQGVLGAKNTLNNLKALGMDNTGLSLDEKGFYDYYIKDIDGIKVAVLAYMWKTTGVNSFENKKFIMHFWDDEQMVKTDIENVKKLGADFVFVLPHWGTEYHRTRSFKQLRWAEKYIGYGADAVIGSHPHVVQPMRMMKALDEDGKTREGLVVYSLGNFLANMRNRFNNTGVVLNVAIRKTADGVVTLDAITYVPTLIMSDKIYKTEAENHVVLPAGKYAHNEALLNTLDDEHKEKVVNAYNDIVEMFGAKIATPLDE